MKKLICAIVVVFVCLSGLAQANTTTYKFSFTGADLMSYVYVNGADGTSAAANGLFDGARLLRKYSGYDRTYVASQQADFSGWATTTTDKFLSFNLWGLDGNGAKWGEDYKASSWGATTESAGWTSWTSTWSGSGWGTPPAGYITETMIGWDAATFNDGLNFADSDLASKQFSFLVTFDTADMWWGQNTNGAPNTLPTLTFWFGGWFDDNLWGSENNYYMYEGNMVLTGQQIPVPGAILLGGIGVSLVGWLRRRRTL